MPSAFGIGGGALTEKRYGASLSDADKKILDHTNSDTYKAVRNFGDRVTRDRSFLNSLASEGQSGVSLSSSLVQTTNRADSAERRFSEAVSRSEETRLAFDKGEMISRDLAQDPAYVDAVMDYERAAAQFGTNTQSLAAYFSAKLGNYSMNPARFTENSAVPMTFAGVKDFHAGQAQDDSVNPDMDRTKAANDSDARTRPMTTPQAAPAAGPPGVPVMPPASSRPQRSQVNYATQRASVQMLSNEVAAKLKATPRCTRPLMSATNWSADPTAASNPSVAGRHDGEEHQTG